MIISFKLETDNNILIQKAESALERYHHQLVIGIYYKLGKRSCICYPGHHQENWIRLTDQEINDNVEIESKMIPAVIKVHDDWIAKMIITTNLGCYII